VNTMKVEVIVPDWVNWIAVDKSGRGFGYIRRPAKGCEMWVNGEGFVCLYQGNPPKNWKDELYTWS